MKRIIYGLGLILILMPFSLLAQRSEVGLFAGGSYYLGDLNPNIHFGNTKPAFGGVFRYNLNPRWAMKMNAIYSNIEGDDASSVGYIKQRNLSFKSHLIDISAQIELNFMNYFTGSQKYIFTPYIFTGIALFSFNPKAEINGEWYALQPLGTEGQGTTVYPSRKTYALTQAAVPFGFGFKFSLSKTVCLALEWSMRKTFTDYLDDVSTTYADPDVLSSEHGAVSAALSNRSLHVEGEPDIVTGMQRGNSKNKDWYSFAGLTLTYRINANKHNTCFDFQKRHEYKEYLY